MTVAPYAYPSVPTGPVRPPALPEQPQRYTGMLRGPRRRWWRPLVSLLMVAVLFTAASLLAILPVLVLGLATGVPNLPGYLGSIADTANVGVPAFLYLTLNLGSLILVAGLSIWIVHRVRPRYLSSVAGGIRWRWLLRCVIVVVPLWLIYLGLSFAFSPPTSSDRPEQWVTLLVIALLLVPFQAAGEEYIFRGWLMQNLGSYFARPLVGAIVSITVSTVLFAMAHGSPDPWVLGSLGCFAVSSGIATYRTGGLESGVVMHATNNVLIFLMVISFGGFEESFVSGETTSTPWAFLAELVAQAVVLTAILWQARRAKIDPWFRPATAAPAPAELDAGDLPPVDVTEDSWHPIPAYNRPIDPS